MKSMKVYQCEDCGVQVRRRRDNTEPRTCVECGIERSRANARQISAKKGPYWERRAKGILAYAMTLGDGTDKE